MSERRFGKMVAVSLSQKMLNVRVTIISEMVNRGRPILPDKVRQDQRWA